MKITVLGGTGAMARASVRDLIESKYVSQIVIADIDGEKAKQFADELKSSKVSTIQLDVCDYDRLVETIKGADAVLDGTAHDTSVIVAKGIIEAKVNGCCIGYRADTVQEILSMDKLAKEAGVTYVLSAGISPGASTVFVKYLADKMDQAENIVIYGTSLRPLALSPGLLETFFTEIPEPKMVYENGTKEVPPFAGREEIEYPAPFPPGKYIVYNAQHSEVVTIPLTIKGAKNVTVKMGWHPNDMEALRSWYDLGLFNRGPINVKGTEIVPRDVLAELVSRRPVEPGSEVSKFALKIKVTGKRNGKDVEGSIFTAFLPLEGQKDVAIARATGVPASIIAQMLGRGVKEKGVLPPEVCIAPQEFLNEFLTKPGFEIQESWT